MNKRDHKKYSMDLPEDYTCKDCKNFSQCSMKNLVVAKNEQCEYVPSNFALPGTKSRAEEYVEEHRQKYDGRKLI